MSDGAKRVWKIKWWVMEIEWRKLSDEIFASKQPSMFPKDIYFPTRIEPPSRDVNFYPIRGYPVRPDPNGPDFTRSDKE